MRQSSEWAERQSIMHDIRHLHAAGDFAEAVLMVPEAVRAEALFIHKKMRRGHVHDLRYPIKRNAAPRPHLVGDDQTGIHSFRKLGGDSEVQPSGCDVCKVFGIGEEVPCLRQRDGQVLLCAEMIEVQAILFGCQLSIIPKKGCFVIPPGAVIQKETFYALEKQLIWRLCPVLKKIPTE